MAKTYSAKPGGTYLPSGGMGFTAQSRNFNLPNGADMIADAVFNHFDQDSVAELVSSNAGDTTQSVTVMGIRASDGQRVMETIALTGNVATTGSTIFRFVEQFYLDAVTAGDITLTRVGSATIRLFLTAGLLATEYAHHYVASDESAYITDFSGGMATTNEDIELQLRVFSNPVAIRGLATSLATGYSITDRIFDYAIAPSASTRKYGSITFAPANSWVAVYGRSTGGTGDAHAMIAGFDKGI